MRAPKRRGAWWPAATAGAIGLLVVGVVVGISIANHGAGNSSVVGKGSVTAVPTLAEPYTAATAAASPIPPVTSTSGSTTKTHRSATPAQGRSQVTGSTTTTSVGVSSAGAGSTAPVVVCTSVDFDHKTNACVKADPEVSAGNGGLTVDGDLSFPDYMTGTITLLRKHGATWQRLGGFSTKTYPDVVVIDSNRVISVQLANVFAYGGHRAMPNCSSTWGIEVDDAQGLPLGDAMFVYACK